MSRKDEQVVADDWLWATMEGFRALSRGRPQETSENWRRAADQLSSESPLDPRLAAAKNNVGVACLLLAQEAEGKAQLALSLNLWEQVRNRVSSMDVPVAGRSSAFHLKLAVRHFDAFREIGRKRHMQQCEAAMGITWFNALLAERRCIEERSYETMIERLATGFGPGCPEVRVLRQSARDATGNHSAAANVASGQRLDWYGEKPSRLIADGLTQEGVLSTDARKLVAATHLTALYDPRLRALFPDPNE